MTPWSSSHRKKTRQLQTAKFHTSSAHIFRNELETLSTPSPTFSHGIQIRVCLMKRTWRGENSIAEMKVCAKNTKLIIVLPPPPTFPSKGACLSCERIMVRLHTHTLQEVGQKSTAGSRSPADRTINTEPRCNARASQGKSVGIILIKRFILSYTSSGRDFEQSRYFLRLMQACPA